MESDPGSDEAPSEEATATITDGVVELIGPNGATGTAPVPEGWDIDLPRPGDIDPELELPDPSAPEVKVRIEAADGGFDAYVDEVFANSFTQWDDATLVEDDPTVDGPPGGLRGQPRRGRGVPEHLRAHPA